MADRSRAEDYEPVMVVAMQPCVTHQHISRNNTTPNRNLSSTLTRKLPTGPPHLSRNLRHMSALDLPYSSQY